jgi:crotonobetainyl-CoA:carnitine CoA-transferase CaiB-like acyl-CoA transferase
LPARRWQPGPRHAAKEKQFVDALNGIRILEPGQLVAAPFAAALLADFGAEVIKTELPGRGDPARGLAPFNDTGSSIWWKTVSRNKKSVTLDLRQPKGQAIFRELVKHVDVVLENFRPGVMDGWGLGWEVLREINPKLIMARQSGFGQDGPYSTRPAYGMMVESYGGLTAGNRYSDTPPVITGISDHITGLFIAKAVMVALYHRDVHGGPGQLIDNAAAENTLRLVGDPNITAAALKASYKRMPTSTYPSWPAGALRMAGVFKTRDDKFIAFHSGTPGTSIWENFVRAIGRPDFLDDEPYPAGSEARVTRGREIESCVREFFASRDRADIIAFGAEHDVTIAPIQDMEDILHDPQVAYRGALIQVEDEEMGTLTMVRPTPVLSETPGRVRHAGPKLGAHNDEIYRGMLNMSDEDLAALRGEKVI